MVEETPHGCKLNDMNQTEINANALQMFLISSPFALQPVVRYTPTQNTGVIPYMNFQAPPSSITLLRNSSYPSDAGGKKRKRRNKGKEFNETKSGLFKSNSGEGNTNNTEDFSIKTRITDDKRPVMNGEHPAFEQSNTSAISRLPAVFVRNTCRLCGKFFRSGQLLRQHMLVHTDQRKYQCHYCDRAFKQLSHLQQHHRIHTGEKPYKCQIEGCNRSFPQLSNLQHHYRNHGKPDPPSDRVCIYCDRTYCSEVVLRNHVMKIHLSNQKDPLINRPTKDTEDLDKKEENQVSKADDTMTIWQNIAAVSPEIPPLNLVTDSKDKSISDCFKSQFVDFCNDENENAPDSADTKVFISKSVSPDGVVEDYKEAKFAKKVLNDLSVHFETELLSTRALKKGHQKQLIKNENCKYLPEKGRYEDEITDSFKTRYQSLHADEQKLLSKDTIKFDDFSVKGDTYTLSESHVKEATNKTCDMYNSMMEEMNRKITQSKDLGFVYNYILDSINEETEGVHSTYFLNSGIENNQNNIVHVSCDDIKVNHFKDNSLSSKLTDHSSEVYKSNNEDSFHDADKTGSDMHAVVFSPNGMPQNSNTLTSDRVTSDTSLYDLSVSLSANLSSGKSRKRKAFVPQRILSDHSV